MQRLWSFLYALSLGVSSVAAAMIATSIHRHTEVRNSAVRFVFFLFFFYLWLWSVFRGIFYLDMFLATLVTQSAHEEVEKEYFDALGRHSVAQITELTRPWLSFVLVMGDTALMASSLWMLPMTWELSRLARRSMDRGLAGERAAVRLYCKWVHALIILFFVVEAGYTIQNRGFNSRSYRVLISGNVTQAITLLYVVYILMKLKWAGRKYETINGAVVASPLYKRLKKIMFVYGLFSFQYQIISMILLFSRFDLELPTHVIGISTLLFNNTGTALSIVMGFSQECFIRSFRHYLPQDYATAFVLSDPRAVIAAAAAAHSPPLVNPVFVFTDIESSSELWGLDHGVTMRAAHELHEGIMRTSLTKYRGYEITTCGDAFHLAFHSIRDAVEYCIEVQLRLVGAKWPKELHDRIPATKRKRDKGKHVFFNGLRVRMGVHDAQEVDGVLVNGTHPVTGKVTYAGLSEVIAHDIGEVGAGGEICVTKRVAKWLQRNAKSVAFAFEIDRVGEHRVDQLNIVLDVFDLTPAPLKRRKEVFREHWANRSEDHVSIVVQRSRIQSVHDWSSESIDVVESNYSLQ